MSEQFTPGPWEAYDANEGMFPPRPLWSVANDEFHNPTGDDEPYLDVTISGGCEADAHLMAAAPELYEALERYQWNEHGICNYCGAANGDPEGHESDCMIGNALRKARGEEVT